jgi:voltage-gated potassium channel
VPSRRALSRLTVVEVERNVMSVPPRRKPLARRIQLFAERASIGRAVGFITTFAVGFTLVAALVERLVEPDTFTSYGRACWWAVQTVSTVGYGDTVPTTTAGRAIAAVVMIFGMALIPIVTSVVVAILTAQWRRPD